MTRSWARHRGRGKQVPAREVPPPGDHPCTTPTRPRHCFYLRTICRTIAIVIPADYVYGDRKFGGNAQAITGKRWLHHTSLLWDYDPANMALLKHPSKAPEYREASGAVAGSPPPAAPSGVVLTAPRQQVPTVVLVPWGWHTLVD